MPASNFEYSLAPAAVSAADGAAEEGLHRNSWNKRRGLEPEHEDVINAFMIYTYFLIFFLS